MPADSFLGKPWGGYFADQSCNYTAADWNAFLRAIGDTPHLRREFLCRSQDGAHDVFVYFAGRIDGRAQRHVYLQARQHPCEWKTSWALEGLLEEVLTSPSEDARWLREHVEFVVTPFVQVAEVEAHQHTRKPDYNRSWALPLDEKLRAASPEVYHLRQLLGTRYVGKFDQITDWHCPNGGGADLNHGFDAMLPEELPRSDIPQREMCERFWGIQNGVHQRNGTASRSRLTWQKTGERPGMFKVEAAHWLGVHGSITTLHLRENALTRAEALRYGRDWAQAFALFLRTLPPNSAP